MNNVTELLNAIAAGDSSVSEELFDTVYHELRNIAAARMAAEAPGNTLQPTALVHEVWLRLGGDQQPTWQNRSHFFGAAAEAMRRVLVEHARRKLRLKRGGQHERIVFDESAQQSPVTDEKILQVSEALELLSREDQRKAEIVKLRFFVGLQHEEIAALLDVNEKTVRRNWELAKLRLLQLMRATS